MKKLVFNLLKLTVELLKFKCYTINIKQNQYFKQEKFLKKINKNRTFIELFKFKKHITDPIL